MMTIEWTEEDLLRLITVAEDTCFDGKTAAALEGPESVYLAFAAELWHTFAHLPAQHLHQAIVVYLWNYLKAYHAYPREVAASFSPGPGTSGAELGSVLMDKAGIAHPRKRRRFSLRSTP